MAKRGNPTLVHRDERHARARFSNATVRRIRRRYSEGVVLADMALAFGCHYDTLRRIVRRETYAGVGP